MFKLFGLTLLVGLSTSVQTVVSGAVFLAMGGVAVCRVESPDVNLFIPIPTQLADAGLLVARVAMPEQERERMRQEVEPWLPMVETITGALADLPNGTVLVSVATSEETVRVEKRSGALTVDVDTEDTDVHVSLPARSAKRIGAAAGNADVEREPLRGEESPAGSARELNPSPDSETVAGQRFRRRG